jgi:hypothetical protein
MERLPHPFELIGTTSSARLLYACTCPSEVDVKGQLSVAVTSCGRVTKIISREVNVIVEQPANHDKIHILPEV